jgi:hypothetical protein
MGKVHMISAARFLGLAAGCATLLGAVTWVEPAAAQEACKADVISADGRAKFRPFTKTKELEGRGSAMADAILNWQREVNAKFGERWNSWSDAKDTSFDCAPTKSGKIIGSSFIGCSIRGRPCVASESRREQDVVVEGGRRRDRDRDNEIDVTSDRRSGFRGRDRDRDRDRVREKENVFEGRAYRREMAFQEWLARQRRRDEARAWDHENRHQRWVAAERRRTAERLQAYSEALARYNYRQSAYDRYRSYGYGVYGYRHYSQYRPYPHYWGYSRPYSESWGYSRPCGCSYYEAEYSHGHAFGTAHAYTYTHTNFNLWLP